MKKRGRKFPHYGTRAELLATLIRRLNLVRFTVILLVLAPLGCTGLIEGGAPAEDIRPEEAVARERWTSRALPQLQQSCVACHAGARANVEFLAGTDPLAVRTLVLGFEPAVINLAAPASSRLLTKGAHEGPELAAAQVTELLDWIVAEREAQAIDEPAGHPVLETAPFAPALCTSGAPPDPTCPINDIDLSPLGLPGAKVQFLAQALGSGLYVHRLKVIAGTDGAFIEHPLFVSWPAQGDPVPDSIDRFFDVSLNLTANTDAAIGGGTAGFIGFVASDRVTIHFRSVQPYRPDEGGPMTMPGAGGCKDLASFKTNARAMFAQACASCHAGQDPNASSAMNITGIAGPDDATVLIACNQIKTRVNLALPDQSGIYLAPDPANNNHPFRFTAQELATFRASVNVWINAEKIAP